MNTNNNNRVTITGIISEPFVFDHEVYGKVFYASKVDVMRRSNTVDEIPLIVSGELLDTDADYVGQLLQIHGQFRSHNVVEGQRRRLQLFLYVQELHLLLPDTFVQRHKNNNLSLNGFICRKPIYRESKSGRKICDILLAVNREYKSDYLPCIAWGHNAVIASTLEVGTMLQIQGRIQSRAYIKVQDDGLSENRVAYEVSISAMSHLPAGTELAAGEENV